MLQCRLDHIAPDRDDTLRPVHGRIVERAADCGADGDAARKRVPVDAAGVLVDRTGGEVSVAKAERRIGYRNARCDHLDPGEPA